ncbi:ADPRase [Artaxa digramma nucleopolyhedrovirus]|uniref:ADPRase n=1 Tax=Artaxa digramma nucleopolyhedrovirus TaxID=3070910 RepID=A0AAE6R694_9ABAC|nr:ADPRase [Euproctis digramma nucleopolyhedrovirus]QHB21705.1 ADPRase [Artaxa digramma nucleopolyhedrovirus]
MPSDTIMRCAGLFMITEESDSKAILLCARQSYDDKSSHYHNHEALQSANFLEKISIPRGRRDGHDYFDYETAVREFIEETATFFEKAIVYKMPFVLQWNDNGVVYKYSIYVGVLRGLLQNVSREPNTFCVKLLQHFDKPNKYKISIETRRFNNEIPRYLHITPLADYFKYMNEKQLVTYSSSNYLDFFNFVRNVKSKFDDGRLTEFFSISLQLEKFPVKNKLFEEHHHHHHHHRHHHHHHFANNKKIAIESGTEGDDGGSGDDVKWTIRRPKIVSAMRRELLNLINAHAAV